MIDYGALETVYRVCVCVVYSSKMSLLLAEERRVSFAILGCVVRRSIELRDVLREYPPTQGAISVHRSDDSVVFEVLPPTAEEWNRIVQSLMPKQLEGIDVFLKELGTAGVDVLLAKEKMLEAIQKHASIISRIDENVDEFVSAINTRGPLSVFGKMAVVQHKRIKNGTLLDVSIADVYRDILRKDSDLLLLDNNIKETAAELTAVLKKHEWHCHVPSHQVENVARNPWEMTDQRISRSLCMLKQGVIKADAFLTLHADMLRAASRVASDAEVESTMTRLSRKWVALENRVNASMNEDTRMDDDEIRLLLMEHSKLERCLEPLVHSRFGAPKNEIDDEIWTRFEKMGRITDRDLAELEEKHLSAVRELQTIGQSNQLIHNCNIHYIFHTMIDVYQHLATARHVAWTLPVAQSPPNDTDPERVLDALRTMDAVGFRTSWRRSARPMQVVDDCVMSLLRWFAVGRLSEDYRENLMRRARVSAFREVPCMTGIVYNESMSTALPTLRSAAVALLPRVRHAHGIASHVESAVCV